MVRDRGEPLLERRLGVVHQPMRGVQILAVESADRVRARADRGA
jgi:hypothetical protein